MSQPNLNEDLNIVANSNIKITLLDGDLNIIQALDDEPNDVGGLTSAELKAKFDEGPNKIKTYINGTLIPEILTEEATEAARAAAEAQREVNETQRIENENARIAAEQARVDETNGVVAQANQAAQSWAVGGTGTREGEDTNNAKYWSEQAAAAAGGGVTSFKGRTGAVMPASGDYTAEMVGAYSKEETNTLLQKKADTSSVYSKDESISASTRTALSLPENATPDAALAEIARQLPESGGDIESTDYPSCYYRTVDGVTEWINPPMALGVEYRTTERYLGKPVYVKLVTFGELPINTHKSITAFADNVEKAIDSFGITSDNAKIPTMSYANGYWERCVDVYAWPTGIQIITKNWGSSTVTANIFVKYTKTTD